MIANFTKTLIIIIIVSFGLSITGCHSGGYYYKQSSEKADPTRGYLPSLKHIQKTKSCINNKKTHVK